LAVSSWDVSEVNSSGNIVREIRRTDLYFRDAEYLENGNILVCGHGSAGCFVREYDWNGTVVAEMKTAGNTYWGVYDVERLPNGNTLVANGDKAIEFGKNWTQVWDSGPDVSGIVDVERLPNGNTLMVTNPGNRQADRVIEMATNRTIVWEFKVGHPHDAERLPNGNTLIAESASQRSVMQVSREGKIVWIVKDVRLQMDSPLDADWLPNGNILITITDIPESITWSLIAILSIFLLGLPPLTHKPSSIHWR